MTPTSVIDLRPYLPGIYTSGRALERERWSPDDPAQVVLRVLGGVVAEFDAGIGAAPGRFDPRSAPFADGEVERDFLSLLAAWNTLELEDLLPGETAGAPAREPIGERESTLRHLVMNVAALHRTRGTRFGLELTIWLLFGAVPSILEWAWPAGMQVGVSATVGRDSFLTGAPDLDNRMVIVWSTPAVDAARAGGPPREDAGSDAWRWTEIVVRTGADTILGLQLLGGTGGLGASGLAPLVTEVRRLRRMLTRELPAATDVFVAFAPPSMQLESALRPFMVEVDEVDQDRFSSTVGFARLSTSVPDHA